MAGRSVSSSVAALLADVAAPTPAPGGGSSAAVACALAAALVEMSAGGHERAAALRARALELADADLGSYAPVIEAQRLPADNPTRAERMQVALSEASEVPLAVAEVGAEVAELAAGLAHTGGRHLEGDASAGALLAEAATRAAARLVELNLAEQPGDPRLAAAREHAARAWSARSRLGLDDPR